MVPLTSLLSTFLLLAALFYTSKISGNIWVSSLTENSCSINTLIFIPTKWSQPLSVWKSLEIKSEVWILTRNAFSIEAVFSLLPFKVPTMTLQQSSSILSIEDVRQNTEKSRHLDIRDIQIVPIIWHWSHCWPYSYQSSSSKT